MKTEQKPTINQKYRTQITFLTNSELLNELESVSEMYLYAESYLPKLKAVKSELFNRGLGALFA